MIPGKHLTGRKAPELERGACNNFIPVAVAVDRYGRRVQIIVPFIVGAAKKDNRIGD